MSFSLLSDDECIRILSHLEEPELDLVAEVSKTCARVARCDAVWASRAKDLCARYTFDRRDFEGNFLYLLEQDPLLPAYDGPPLRMPYLTPENSGQGDRKIDDMGLQHRCYPSAQRGRAPSERERVWVTTEFPVTCCGARHASRAALEQHCLDMCHYERMQSARGNGRLPDSWIDPRLRLGQAAFTALPKREQYLRVHLYVAKVLPEIEVMSDPENWDVLDKANLERLSRQGLAFLEELIAGANRDGFDEDCFDELVACCRADLEPTAIGEHICAAVAEGFRAAGVYSEVPNVPYFSVRDFLTSGLAGCDPDGGSSSGAQWWSGVSEIFEHHYEGELSW